MAVFDDYIQANIAAGQDNRAPAHEGKGTGNVVEFLLSFDTVAAHDAGSIYRIIKGIPVTAVPLEISIWTDGVTGMNDVDLGLYKPLSDGGAAVSAEALASAIDLSSAVTRANGFNNGLGNITNSNYGKMLYELAGETLTSRQASYDIGLKSVADLSEADTIVVYARFLFL